MKPSSDPLSSLTKATPPLRRGSIPRRATLWAKLREGLNRRLIVVQAGPGFGKTDFLASFAHSQLPPEGIPTAWLTFDSSHRDRISLLKDMALAFQAVQPETGRLTLSALAKTRDALGRWHYFLDLFCRELDESIGQPAVLILDQYDRVDTAPGARETIDYLLVALPPTLTMLISTRQPLNLHSIPRLRVEGEVWELSARDLCFDVDEARHLFIQQTGGSISAEALEQLMAKTAGWPAMVHMAVEMMRTESARDHLNFSGSLPEVYDYLDEEAFHRETAAARRFLMSTALPEQFSSELGRELVPDNEALATLARLERGDHFVSVVETGSQRLYRYNPIFRDFLLTKLRESYSDRQLRSLHLKLAEFFNRSELWDAAIHHFIAAAEYQRASELVASLAEGIIAANNLDTLAGWIDAFPPEERERRPWLLLYRGVAHRVNREWEAALGLYSRAGQLFLAQRNPGARARTLWFASQILTYRRNQQAAIALAKEALDHMDPEDIPSRAWILHNLGNAGFELGQTREALQWHREAGNLFAALNDLRGEMTQSHALALALHRLGHLKEAQQHYLEALKLQAQTGDMNVLCWVQAGLAHLRAQRGDVSDSVADLREVVEMARTHHLLPAETFALSRLAEVYLELGDHEAAELCCQQAIVTSEGFDDAAAQIDVQLIRIELNLRQGRLDLARQSSPSVADMIAASNLEMQRISHILLETELLAAAQEYDQAEKRAVEARSLSVRIGARCHEACACFLLARIQLLSRKTEESAWLTGWAVGMSEVEGYVSLFLRDSQASIELFANAMQLSHGRERWAELLRKLAEVNQAFAPLLLGSPHMIHATDTVVSMPELQQLMSVLAVGTEENVLPVQGKPPQSEVVQIANAMSEPQSLAVYFLGPLRVRCKGLAITDRAWRTTKAKELLAYLLTRPDKSASRDELLEVLWPEAGIDSAVSNFHFTLHSLRRALGPHISPGSPSSFVALSGRSYCLDLPGQTWVDVEAFKSCVNEAEGLLRNNETDSALPLLEKAVALYGGDYMVDIYADWVEPERQSLLEGFLGALRQLARISYARRDFGKVVQYANAIIEKDRYFEQAHRLLMRAASETGNPALALRHYDQLASLLDRDIGAQPARATRNLYSQIKSGVYQRPTRRSH